MDLLSQLPQSLPTIMGDRSLWSGKLAQGMTGAARRIKGSDLCIAREIAECAVVIAGETQPTSETTADALLAVGEIARASADWSTAQAAYSMAGTLISDRLKNDPIRIKADLWSALLLRDLRRFDEAECLAKSALVHARSISSTYWVRGSLGIIGSIVGTARPSDPASAQFYREAIKIDAGPLMLRHALVGLVSALVLSGHDLDEASHALREAENMDVPEDPSLDLHIAWTRGLLCSRRGRYIPAREFLEHAASQMIELDRPAYAGSCLMDLAALHLEHGRADRAAKISAQLWPLFSRLKVDREAFAAAKLYTESAARGALTVAMVQQIKRTLELSAPNIPPRHAH